MISGRYSQNIKGSMLHLKKKEYHLLHCAKVLEEQEYLNHIREKTLLKGNAKKSNQSKDPGRQIKLLERIRNKIRGSLDNIAFVLSS